MRSVDVVPYAIRRDRTAVSRLPSRIARAPITLADRRGVTLYEVVLSLAIFAGSMAALAQGIAVGSRAAVKAHLQTQAILNCESKLSEVLAGVEPMQAVDGVPLSPGHDDWTWSLRTGEGPHPDLLVLELSVQHRDGSSAVNAEYSVTRLIRDPSVLADSAEMPTGP